jgi:putative membrane protein
VIEIVFFIILSALIGTILGTITGLIPGLHVNNVAIILLSLTPISVSVLKGGLGLDNSLVLLMVSSSIVATSMTHTFLDFIPSTFLGAPEPETALSVLPAHGMLMEGNGYKAVFLSAVGSFGAVIVGSLLLLPYRLVVNEPLNGYSILKDIMVWVLMGVVILMLTTETAKLPYILRKAEDGGWKWETGRFSNVAGIIAGFGLFMLSGSLGMICLSLNVGSPFGLPSTVLFPLLSGLFGTATLIESLRGGADVPKQEITENHVNLKDLGSSITSGGFAGSVVGFLPGMSGGVATIIAMLFRKEPKPTSVILTLSAINTANSFFVLSALFLILRPRSGAAIVVNELVDATLWDKIIPPNELSLLLISAVIASTLGFFLTLFMGKKLANLLPKLPYNKVVIGIIIFIVIMVFAFTGPIGLLTLFVSTTIGMIAPLTGIRRSHAMGVLLFPVIMMLW